VETGAKESSRLIKKIDEIENENSNASVLQQLGMV
jgi:hypothetical protein